MQGALLSASTLGRSQCAQAAHGKNSGRLGATTLAKDVCYILGLPIQFSKRPIPLVILPVAGCLFTGNPCKLLQPPARFHIRVHYSLSPLESVPPQAHFALHCGFPIQGLSQRQTRLCMSIFRRNSLLLRSHFGFWPYSKAHYHVHSCHGNCRTRRLCPPRGTLALHAYLISDMTRQRSHSRSRRNILPHYWVRENIG